ncbi:MAG: decaprenyl-phosphate phosphoribosyltransferase [Planctomycetes bacterium]|nr:decaprenyl-phosphate phosphoribosyltransferase [Planctomycetota bacterium]
MSKALLQALRPHQWVKNLLVFVALVFDHRLGEWSSVRSALMAFAVFCLLSSSVYLLNDVIDREADRAHPRKRNRPVASGALPVPVALLASLLAAGGAVGWGFAMSDFARPGLPFVALPIAYLVLQLGYSFLLKTMLIVDCLCIALGFLFRVHAGSVALVDVKSSSWLLLCTFFFSLFVAFSKRRDEVINVSDGSGATRKTMKRYTQQFLDQVIPSLAAISILSYALYTVAAETIQKHQSRNLIVTVPIVVYGVYRYQYLVSQGREVGDPARVLFRDRPLVLSGLAYALVVWLAITLRPLL